MSMTGPSTLKERIAALQQRGTSPQPISPPRSHTPTNSPKVTGGLRDKIARFEEKGGTPIPRGSFGLGAPPQPTGKRSNELWGNRIPSARRFPSGNTTGSLSRSATLSANPSGRTRRVSASDVRLGGLHDLQKDMGALSVKQPMALEEEGSKASETISSLDTASRTPTSPSFVGRSSVQSESQTSGPQEEECTVVLSDTEQPVTGMENRNAPDALIPVPIVSLNEGNSGATQSVPEVNTAIIHIASEIDEASSSPYSKDVPLNEANDAQSLEGQARSSLPHYQTAQTDTGQLDTPPPLEVSVVEVAPSEEDAAAVPREPPMTVTRETKVNLAITLDILTIPTPSFDPRDPADALSVEELENDGQPPGKPPNSEAELTPVQAEPEANVFGQPTQPSSSSTNQLQAEFSSSSPSLSSETSTIPLHDATPVPQPVVHQDLPQHSAPSTFVSAIDSSMTLNTSSNLLGEPHAPTATELRLQSLTNSSQRPLSTASTTVSETSCDSLPHVSPILDAFPAVPRYLPSISVPARAHTVCGHRPAADRGSISSILSTPSLSFSSTTSSSSTCSPTSTSIGSPQPSQNSRRSAVPLQRAKSQSRPISSVPAWYDDDSDDGEAGWANVVVTRRYY